MSIWKKNIFVIYKLVTFHIIVSDTYMHTSFTNTHIGRLVALTSKEGKIPPKKGEEMKLP